MHHVWLQVSSVLGLVITGAVALVTVGFNFLVKLLLINITRREGQDTRTEEERSLFAKLSLAYIFNSVRAM